jgi:hypothetical protein
MRILREARTRVHDNHRLAPIVLPREVCTDYAIASRREWLETNGTGGFAMGTVSGANTRRYHGLLVASKQPPVAELLQTLTVDLADPRALAKTLRPELAEVGP